MIAPPPFTPLDCDLRTFEYMPLHVRRFRDSAIATSEDAEAFRAATMLWSAAWHQVPAGSLADNDKELANFAGFGRFVSEWLKVRELALHGFVLCSDGRLYHRTVCEVALESWRGRLIHQKRSAAGNARKYGGSYDPDTFDRSLEDTRVRLEALKAGDYSLLPPLTVPQAPGRLPTGSEKPSLKEGEAAPAGSQGKGSEGSTVPSERLAKPSADPNAEAWARGKRLLVEAGKLNDNAAGAFFGKLLKDGLEARQFLSAIITAEQNGTQDPRGFLTGVRRRLLDRGGSQPAERVADPSTWTDKDWSTVVTIWRDSSLWDASLGPKPGQPGCRVPGHLLEDQQADQRVGVG